MEVMQGWNWLMQMTCKVFAVRQEQACIRSARPLSSSVFVVFVICTQAKVELTNKNMDNLLFWDKGSVTKIIWSVIGLHSREGHNRLAIKD